MFYDERFAQTHLTHAVPNYAQLAEAYGCAGFTVETEEELEAALTAAFAAGRSAVVDVRCAPEEKCFPMIPAGAAALDVVEAPGERGCRELDHTHDLGPAGEQAGRARPRLAAVLAPRLQHPEPRGRADRAAGHLAADTARRLQRALARADREADAQARQRAPRHRASSRRGDRARARTDHRRDRRRTSGPSSSRSAS